MSEETLSSLEATEQEKRMLDALSPLPISNERSWAIIRAEQSLGMRVYQREAIYWYGVAQAALEALHAVNNSALGESISNNEELRIAVGYAFKKAEEFKLCGDESPDPSSESEPQSSP